MYCQVSLSNFKRELTLRTSTLISFSFILGGDQTNEMPFSSAKNRPHVINHANEKVIVFQRKENLMENQTKKMAHFLLVYAFCYGIAIALSSLQVVTNHAQVLCFRLSFARQKEVQASSQIVNYGRAFEFTIQQCISKHHSF